MLNAVEHANFFENRATEYSKASTAGTWDEVWTSSSDTQLSEPAVHNAS
jgi:ribonucleoside-diphosphate reductase beta chain